MIWASRGCSSCRTARTSCWPPASRTCVEASTGDAYCLNAIGSFTTVGRMLFDTSAPQASLVRHKSTLDHLGAGGQGGVDPPKFEPIFACFWAGIPLIPPCLRYRGDVPQYSVWRQIHPLAAGRRVPDPALERFHYQYGSFWPARKGKDPEAGQTPRILAKRIYSISPHVP